MVIVNVWGMDRWSGRELERELEFKDRKEALDFIKEHNSKNTAINPPEYYSYAELDN